MSINENSRPRCPICGKLCRLNTFAYPGPWFECGNEDCEIFGMEGCQHHFHFLGKIIDHAKLEKLRTQEGK
jgi:hypothetical protein